MNSSNCLIIINLIVMGNFCFLAKKMSFEAGLVKFDGTVLAGSVSMSDGIKFRDYSAEFVSCIVRIVKGDVLLIKANVDDEVSIFVERKFGMQLPSRMSGKLLLGTGYDNSNIGNILMVSIDEDEICALEKARAMFYFDKMKSEGAVVKLDAENKTIQIELLIQVYVPLNTECTFNYNSYQYKGKVVKIIK